MSTQREAFEKWAAADFNLVTTDSGAYISGYTLTAWAAWKAAQAAMQAALINPEGALIKLEGVPSTCAWLQAAIEADAARYQHLRRNVEVKRHRNKQGRYEFEFPSMSTAEDVTLDGIDRSLGEAIDAEIARTGSAA